MSSLQVRIIEAMERANLKQIDLARLAGVSRATVSLWVNGQTKVIEGDNLTRAARALNVDAHWLATGEQRITGRTMRVEEPSAAYNSDEQRLLQLFRSLSSEDRSRAITILAALLKTSTKRKIP